MARESLFTLPRWSFGLRQLFLWMTAIALGLVALRSATMTWVAGMLGLAIAVLAASILLAVYRRGAQRAYWSGFATFGWLYLLLVFGSWTLGRMAHDESPLRAHNLLTQQLSNVSYHWLYDKAFEKYYLPAAGGMTGGYGSGEASYGSAGMMPGGMPTVPGMGGQPMGTGPMPVAFSYSIPGPPPGPNESDFVNVAHALWTLLFAAMGGCLAYWLYATGPGRNELTAAASS